MGVQCGRYMTLETIAPLGEDPILSLPQRQPDDTGQTRRRARKRRRSYITPGDMIQTQQIGRISRCTWSIR